MKVVFSGLEGSGKSLKLAMTVVEIVHRNIKWFKETGIARPIISNLKFSEEFQKYVIDNGLKIVYWEHLDELIKFTDCDVIIDELGNYFDARMWTDLSLDVRRWLTQGSKCGIEIYGSAQDFAQVDKSFRRLVNFLFEIRKLVGSRRPSATTPPVKKIWGICRKIEIDPRAYKEDDKKYDDSSSIFTFLNPMNYFFIREKYCKIFDTGQKIVRGKFPPLRHETRYCEKHLKSDGDGSCDYCKELHI